MTPTPLQRNEKPEEIMGRRLTLIWQAEDRNRFIIEQEQFFREFYDILATQRQEVLEEATEYLMNYNFSIFDAETALMDGNVKMSTVEQKIVIDYKELITALASLEQRP